MGGARITLMPKEALVFTSCPALTSSRAVLTAKPPQRHKPRKLPILALQTNPYLRARGPPQRQTSNPPSKHQSSIRTDTTQRTTNMGRPKNMYT